MSISFEQVSKRYGANTVVNDVSLEITSGEFFVLLGPSGSGKSTLLRAAAGLVQMDHGRLRFDGRDVTDLPARERGVGLVFQHYALFRHMTVAQNVEFALRVRGVKGQDRRRRRDELLGLVALDGFADRMPGQLSGGQQQRVAVARALVHEPAVLLLDEPFGALDAQIRVELRETIRRVQRRLGMTTILVTHDQEEAFALGDRIGVMNNGRLLETGKPETLYRNPATRFVATFLGAANLLLGELAAGELRLGSARIKAEPSWQPTASHSETVTVVRPEDLEIAESAERLSGGLLSVANVQALSFAGGLQRIRLQLPLDTTLQSATTPAAADAALVLEATRNSSAQLRLPLVPGQQVHVAVRRVHLLPTPISSFRLLTDSSSSAAALKRAPLLSQLADSMRARIIDTTEAAGESPGALLSGVAVSFNGTQAIPAIGAALLRGTRRVLCIPHDSPLPKRVVITTADGGARGATLALVASVLRHLQAEATYVSVHEPAAGRAEVAEAFRRLLDARAELQRSHGLDIRTDMQIGELSDWLARLAAGDEPTLIVLGISGEPAEIEATLLQRFQPVLAGRCPVLLSCSRAPAVNASDAYGALKGVETNSSKS
jgi:sulfate/thiosulfate transport system ATP-binding protein